MKNYITNAENSIEIRDVFKTLHTFLLVKQSCFIPNK